MNELPPPPREPSALSFGDADAANATALAVSAAVRVGARAGGLGRVHGRDGFAAQHIDAGRNWLQVLPIDASRSTTQVVDLEARGNRTDPSLIGEAMGANQAPPPPAGAEEPIGRRTGLNRSCPQPAPTRRDLDLFEESFNRIASFDHPSSIGAPVIYAQLRAVLNRLRKPDFPERISQS